MLRFLNAIAVAVSNRKDFALAIKILEIAQSISPEHGEINQLIKDNLTTIKNNNPSIFTSISTSIFSVVAHLFARGLVFAILSFILYLFK